MYEQPWTRISPYFFGISLGYILHKTEDKLRINLITLICGSVSFLHFIECSRLLSSLCPYLLYTLFFFLGWIACLFLFTAILFSKTVIKFSNQWVEATLSVATHTIWSMILFWIILASISLHRGKT